MNENFATKKSIRNTRILTIICFVILFLFIWWLRPGDATNENLADKISIRKTADTIQYKNLDGPWKDIISLDELDQSRNNAPVLDGKEGTPGKDGANGQNGVDGRDGSSGNTGSDGREIDIQKTTTYVQWRYENDSDWKNLIALSELTGATGAKGDKGDMGDAGNDGNDGSDGAPGAPGSTGATGPANSLAIGSVTASDCNPTASITGLAPSQTLNLGIPGLPSGGATGQVLTKNSATDCDAGWKDTYERRGTGMPNGVVTAPTGTYYTDTAMTNGAIRWVKTTSAGNTGWQVIQGDTGWRDVSTLMLPAAMQVSGSSEGGKAMIRRVNETVYTKVVFTQWGASWSAGAGINNPGFYMMSSGARLIPGRFGAIGNIEVSLTKSGGLSAEAGAARTTDGRVYEGTQTFTQPVTSDALPWPTTLPGTAVTNVN